MSTRSTTVTFRVAGPSTESRTALFEQKSVWSPIAIAALPIAGVIGEVWIWPDFKSWSLTEFWIGSLLVVLSIGLPVVVLGLQRFQRVFVEASSDGLKFRAPLGASLLGLMLCSAGLVELWPLLFRSALPLLMVLLVCVPTTVLAGMFIFAIFRPASLTLSPRKIEFRYGLRWRTSRIDWVDCSEPYMGAYNSIVLPATEEDIPLPTSGLATDPRIIASLIEFYRTNPELRSELGDGSAIARLRNGELPIEWVWRQ